MLTFSGPAAAAAAVFPARSTGEPWRGSQSQSPPTGAQGCSGTCGR